MTTYAYIRVSTEKQAKSNSLEHQLQVLKPFKPDKIFSDEASGSTMLRSGLYNLTISLTRNDTVVIKDISRLSRVKEELFRYIEFLRSNNINLHVANIPYSPYTSEWYKQIMIDIDLAENKLYNNQFVGKKGGRPRLSISTYLTVLNLTNEGQSISSIAQQLGISIASVTNIRRVIRIIQEKKDQGYNPQTLSTELGLPIEYITAIN